MALGSFAVMGVYAAGWYRTKAAAERFASDAVARRPPAPSSDERPRIQAVERVAAPGSAIVAPPAGPRGMAAAAAAGTSLRAGAQAGVPPLPPMTRLAPVLAQAPEPSPPADIPSGSTVAPVPPSVGVRPSAADGLVARETATAATASLSAPVDSAPHPAAPVAAPSAAPARQLEPTAHQPEPAVAKWKDGTYFGWGTSRHGDIQAAVTIQAGRITSALISQCLTRYSCSWISALPPQVVTRQGAEVDYVSGATQSTNAFYYAVLEALARAK